MPQSLHLLIVDRRQRAALVARYGSRWLLPVLRSRERARVDPFITGWLAEQGVLGSVVGHWLGRPTPAQGGMDWLVVVDASLGTGVTNAELAWTALDALVSNPCVLQYQRWAVSTSLQHDTVPSVEGPFGNVTWLDDVKAWISSATGVAEPGPITPYRVTSHEVVLGVDTTLGRVYFKGLPSDRSVEVRLTKALSELVPQTFARTLASERREDGCVWWLTSECPGRDLAVRSDARMTAKVARALARVQRDALSSATVLGELKPVNLSEAAAWAADVLDNSPVSSTTECACADVANADVPQTWLPLDLDPVNVFVDDDELVSFIDLDDSFIGPAPLAMAMFARRARDRSGYQQYEEGWVPFSRRIDWPAFELAAAVLEAWLGWKRVVKNTERGEVHGVLDMAAASLARTLTMAISGGRSPSPAPPGGL